MISTWKITAEAARTAVYPGGGAPRRAGGRGRGGSVSTSPHQATIFLDPHFAVGEVNPRLFGSFLEHLGRAVYTGVFEPEHPSADADGLRTDVLALIRELGVT